jgi:hypothetical protein
VRCLSKSRRSTTWGSGTRHRDGIHKGRTLDWERPNPSRAPAWRLARQRESPSRLRPGSSSLVMPAHGGRRSREVSPRPCGQVNPPDARGSEQASVSGAAKQRRQRRGCDDGSARARQRWQSAMTLPLRLHGLARHSCASPARERQPARPARHDTLRAVTMDPGRPTAPRVVHAT